MNISSIGNHAPVSPLQIAQPVILALLLPPAFAQTAAPSPPSVSSASSGPVHWDESKANPWPNLPDLLVLMMTRRLCAGPFFRRE
jgi:hypothetical protein